jgi:Arylsulfotransferase (ASST)
MRQSTLASLVYGPALCLVVAVSGAGCAVSSPWDGEGGTNGSGGSNTGKGGSNSGGSATGGTSSSGGSGGSARGGNTGTGGVLTTGTGGRVNSGGSGGPTGSGGANNTGGSMAAGGSGSGACTVSVMASSNSTKIPTVGIVTFTTSLSSPKQGHIDFGLDTTYGMTAPVDFTQANNRTLLLGMKASKTYHYQITVSDGASSCTSGDQTIKSGPLPNGGLPTLTITTNNKAALYGGFLVVGGFQGSTYQSYVIDGDGEFVWWYSIGADGCGTRMSYDGQYMWINNANVPDMGAKVHRVTMDGLTDTDFSTAFKGASHQVTPLPDGSVAFYATGSNSCDDIKIFPAKGTPTSTAMTVVNAKTAHGGSGACHVNNIEYDPSDDTLVFSDLDNVCLTKVSKTGSTTWVLAGTNGVTSTFSGDLWVGGEHGFHIISPTDYVIFNNNTPNASTALELILDPAGKKSKKQWSYTASPALKVMVLGDVQRMTSNGPTGAGKGNTIVEYGTGNHIQEVDANGTLLQDISSKSPFGFMEKRASLYGPPTR